MGRKIYVRFMGGLGNQLFQYAYYRSLVGQGKNVYANLNWYKNHSVPFELTKVFPKAVVKQDKKYSEGMSRWNQKVKKLLNLLTGKTMHKEFFYVEEKEDAAFDVSALQVKSGTLNGYWQTEKYFDNITEDIRHIYIPEVKDQGLIYWMKQLLECDNAVSVHIRRGDYLNTSDMYGNICTLDYYKKAMKEISKTIEQPTYYIFSNDEAWVREQFAGENIVFIPQNEFEHYENWYDLLLMSCCRSNIIANSSFSWWAAWLNSHKDKIVIAPDKWLNNSETPDIWCKGWIKIPGIS